MNITTSTQNMGGCSFINYNHENIFIHLSTLFINFLQI